MKSHARVVVIGGGIGGCSALYHLTQEGWNDVVLVEAHELTSGTTWHSAAQCPNLAFNQLLIGLRSETIALYKGLADDPDDPIDYHHAVGGLRLITDSDQLDACRHIVSVAAGMGVTLDVVSPAAASERNPLLETTDLVAALWDPLDGDIDPAQLCHSLARHARRAGAEIYRFNPVVGLTQHANHEWTVHTKNGDITCEFVVVAAGYRVNEVGAMLDIEYPVVAMEHMYFVTEPVDELVGRDSRVAMVRCPRDTFYMRQEKDGLLVGVYEYDCKTFGMDGIDPDFVSALCPDDLDRCLPKLEAVFARFPCLQDAGIKAVVNGPIAYAADAGPLVGKHPGRRNLWSMNGLRVGIGEGGGYGKMLAQMMVHGEAQWDTWQLDPRRVTAYANREYAALKAIEDYQNEFRWHLPHEHRSAGRPAKTTSLYPVLKSKGAEFGVVNGWERVSFYKPHAHFIEEHSYRFANWHGIVADEVKALCDGVGIAEMPGFNRYEVRGQGGLGWLDSLTCSRAPQASGRVGLCYFLTDNGNVLSEATLANLGEGCVWYGSAAAAEYHDMDWLVEHLPAGSDIEIVSLTNTHTTLVVAGPRSRELMQTVAPRTDWSVTGFPWLAARTCCIGHVEAVAMSVSYCGEQAFELHVENSGLQAVYDALTQSGKRFGLSHFGMYAIESMRLEKGYCHWKAELVTEFNPLEAGLERFVNMNKDFPGKSGLQRQAASGHRRKLATLVIQSDKAPAQPGESVFSEGVPVGTITSAGWGYRTGKNIALAYMDPGHADIGSVASASLPGETVRAEVTDRCLYDPRNEIPQR